MELNAVAREGCGGEVADVWRHGSLVGVDKRSFFGDTGWLGLGGVWRPICNCGSVVTVVKERLVGP